MNICGICKTECKCWKCGSPLTVDECQSDGYLDLEDRHCSTCPERKYRFLPGPGVQVEKEQP